MAKNTSILLGDYFDRFITSQISSGRFSSVSEVIKNALRLMENEQRNRQALRQALIEGEQSGFVEDFDPIEFKKELLKSGLD